MFPNAYSMNIMSKWIVEEETWIEILSLGGVNFIIKMARLGDKQIYQKNNIRFGNHGDTYCLENRNKLMIND